MKKKLGILALCLSLMLTACGKPAAEPDTKESDDDEIVIELSDKKVEIEAGEDVEVEIENYDDLSKVKVSVEDEDIAECDIDDEIITITGVSEGKTKVIVSAKGAEDVSITVKVTEGEEPATPAVVAPAVDFPQASRYTYTFELSGNVWFNMFDKYEDYRDLADFLGELNIGLDFNMDFKNDTATSGSGVLTYDVEGFGHDFVNALSDDNNFREFVKVLMEAEGYDYYDDSMYDQVVDMKDELIDELDEEIMGEMEDSNESYDFTWSIEGSYLTINIEGESYTVYVDEYDGSFAITLSEADLGYNPIFDGGLNMVFYPER